MTLEHKPACLPEVSTEVPVRDSPIPNILGELLQENPDLYGDIQSSRHAEWRRTIRAFEEEPDDFYNAWHYLNDHPLFWYFAGNRHKPLPFNEKYIETQRGMPEALDISVMKVNPATGRISCDKSENTKTEVWYEICVVSEWPAQYDAIRTHVWQIDGGGDTYEQAIVKAARQLHETYGNDRQTFDAERSGHSG
jgi:hypothetical protein